MDIFKIGIIGIAAVIICGVLKEKKEGFALYVSMSVCLIISFFIVGKLEVIIEAVKVVQGFLTIKESYLAALFKMIGVTYIAEFASGLCKDSGYNSIANQIEMFVKLSVMALSMPILIALMQTIEGFLT